MEIRTTDCLMISGKRGTGKTFFTKWYITEHLLGVIKVLIWDPLWQYGDLGKCVHALNSISMSMIENKKEAIVYQPHAVEDTEEHFDMVAHWIFRTKNMVFIAEEINEYMTPWKIPPRFRALVRRGRNYNIGVMGITHRPAYMSPNYVNQIDHWFIFQQDLKADLDRLVEYIQRADETINQDYIATMADRHFLHMYRDRDTGQTEVIKCAPVVPKKMLSTLPNAKK